MSTSDAIAMDYLGNTTSTSTRAVRHKAAAASAAASIKSFVDTTESNDSGYSATPPKPPSWESIQAMYDQKWQKEKVKFQNSLLENLNGLVSQYKSGRQEIYQLSLSSHTKHYESAFRETFADTGFQATCGEVETLGSHGNKKVKKLYITLPQAFA